MSKKLVREKQPAEGQMIQNEALLKKACARIALLHPACPECRQIFAACGGSTIKEWEAKLAGEEPRDAFCVRVPFWSSLKSR